MKKVLGIALLGSLLLTGMAFSNLIRDKRVTSDREPKGGCPFATMLSGTNQERICPVTGMRERSASSYHRGTVGGLLVAHSSQQGVKAQSTPGVKGKEHSVQGCPMSGTKTSSFPSCPRMGVTKAASSDVCPMMQNQTASALSCPMAGNGGKLHQHQQGSSKEKKDLPKGLTPVPKGKVPNSPQTPLPKDAKGI